MPDNRISGMDPGFVDRAWKDMQRQLDEAMPVEKQSTRRILVWWWLAALLLPALAYGWWQLRTDHPGIEALPIPLYGHPVADLPMSPAPRNIADGALSGQAIAQTTDTPKEEPGWQPQSVEGRPVQAASHLEPMSSHQTTMETTTPTIAETSGLLPVKSTAEAGTRERSIPGELSPETYVEEDLTTARQHRRAVAAPGFLPALTASLPELAAFDLPKQPNSRRRSTNWYLEAGASSRDLTGLSGLEAGIGKAWKKTGSRWSFTLGLHYRFQRLPFNGTDLGKVNLRSRQEALFNAQADMEEATGGAAQDPLEGSFGFVSSDTVLQVTASDLRLVQKLHFLELPLRLHYRLDRRFQLHGTMRLSYLTNALMDLANGGFSQNYDQQAYSSRSLSASIGWYNNQANARLGYNRADFHRLQLGLGLGLTYYPTSRLGLQLQYHSSTMSLYRAASLDHYDHWLGTSLVCRFGPKR